MQSRARLLSICLPQVVARSAIYQGGLARVVPISLAEQFSSTQTIFELATAPFSMAEQRKHLMPTFRLFKRWVAGRCWFPRLLKQLTGPLARTDTSSIPL